MWIHSFTLASSKKIVNTCYDVLITLITILHFYLFFGSHLTVYTFNKDFQYQLNSLCFQMALENLDKWEIFFVSYREHPLVLNYKEAGWSTYQPKNNLNFKMEILSYNLYPYKDFFSYGGQHAS